MALLKLSSPWMNYYHEISAFFRNDPDVRIVYDEEENEIKVYVSDNKKAVALSELLPTEKVYGNVILKVTVVLPNSYSRIPADQLFDVALKGNTALSFIKTVQGVLSNNLTYVVFKKEVVQYFNDNLGDIYGNCSTLYQEIAKDIFNAIDGVYYCTDFASASLTISSSSNGVLSFK